MYTLHVFGSASYITQFFAKIMISVSFSIYLNNVYKLSKHHVLLPYVKNCENEHAHISLRTCVVLLSVNTDTIKTLKSVNDQTAHCNLWFQLLKSNDNFARYYMRDGRKYPIFHISIYVQML